jgi:hypothetical protein
VRFFFNYSLDCELPPEGAFGGPESWDFAEEAVRGFVEVMGRVGCLAGASLFVYPDVARRQRALFLDMAERGVEIALHLNGLRYSRIRRPAWLGSMPREEQREALRVAKADLEDTLGRPCLGYRACYTSTNHDTFPICEELGFTWTSTSAAGSYKPQFYACWAGGWPFPYHPSHKNKLVPGDLKLYEMPIARGIRTMHQGDPDRPLDLRAETPPAVAGERSEVFRRIIEEQIAEMKRRDQPVCGLFGASHNTSRFADPATHAHRNLIAVCRDTRALAEAEGYEFTPSSFLKVREHAETVGAF